MAVEKGKVTAELNKLFQGKSGSKELKEKYAARWAEKIENDEDIEAYVKDREDDVLDASKEGDKRAHEAVRTAKQEAADLLNGKKKDDTKVDEIPDGAPDWFKSYMEKDKAEKTALSEKLTAIETAKSTESLADRFKKDERLKGVPEFMMKGRVPTKEEDFENSVAELQTDYTKFAIDNKIAVLGQDQPAGQGGAAGGKKEASQEQLDAAVDKLNIKI